MHDRKNRLTSVSMVECRAEIEKYGRDFHLGRTQPFRCYCLDKGRHAGELGPMKKRGELFFPGMGLVRSRIL